MMIAGTGREIMLAGITSAILAQLIKLITYLIRYHRFNFQMLTTAGGMPSSHSSSTCAVATSVGLVAGFESVEFAIALGVALVVMYDAAGVRRAAGRVAATMNRMAEDVYKHHPEHLPDRLRELLGHTPFEVFVGALFGIVFAVGVHEALQ